jgi:ribonuclease P protein component
VSKRTYQPNNRRRHKVHGFRLRMRTRAGRSILSARRRKGRNKLAVRATRACLLCRAVLDRRHRLTRSAGFTTATRRGRRAGTRHLVLHVASGRTQDVRPGRSGTDPAPAQVGFVVSKAVGNAVRRNRVKRRLRHLARERLDRLPAGAVVVVRALPASADASFSMLSRDLDTALARLDLAPQVVDGR